MTRAGKLLDLAERSMISKLMHPKKAAAELAAQKAADDEEDRKHPEQALARAMNRARKKDSRAIH
jgi:hypothetical protein